MRSLFHTKTAAYMIGKSVLSNSGFSVRITETIEKMVDKADDEYLLHGMKEAWTSVAAEKPSTACSVARTTSPTKVPSNSESHKEPNVAVFVAVAHLIASAVKNQYGNLVIRYWTMDLTVLLSIGAVTVIIQCTPAATGGAIRQDIS